MGRYQKRKPVKNPFLGLSNDEIIELCDKLVLESLEKHAAALGYSSLDEYWKKEIGPLPFLDGKPNPEYWDTKETLPDGRPNPKYTDPEIEEKKLDVAGEPIKF